MNQYDAVVIGAGNGGLVAAIRLLQGGLKTLVVEKHNLPGGFATSFRRGRFEFEASLHELNDFGTEDNKGDVRVLFDELGVTNKIEWLQIPEAYRVIVKSENLDAVMPFGKQAFIDQMEKYVPGSKKSMEHFFELAEEIRTAQAYTNKAGGKVESSYMVKNFPNYVKTGSYSVNEVLDALKMPKKAKDILNAYWCYLGADCDTLSFTHYASMVLRYITKGAAMPKMRSHEISLALVERIRELGGDIWFNVAAEKILTDKNGVSGVVLADGREIKTRYVIANCSPHLVFGKMLDNVSLNDVKATNARKFAGRGFSMFLGLNKSCEELGIDNHNYFLYDTMDTAKQYELMKKIDTNYAQATVCLNRAYPECSPKGTTIMYFTTLYMSDDWGNVKPEDYFKVKNKVAKMMIERFEKDTGCNLRDHIEEISIATPMTYAHYCGHPEGVIYGYESQYWDGLNPRLLMMAQDHTVRGLRFAGGYSMRLSGYSSAYFSGDISGRQTVGDFKRGE